MSTVSGTRPAAQWIAIASLIRPQGRRGELLAEPLSDLPEIFVAGREVHLAKSGATTPDSDSSPIALEDHWFPTGKNAGRVVLKLSACNSISQAEALANWQLLVRTDSLPKLADDTYYVGDLLNCDLFDGSRQVGRIVDVEFTTAPDGRTRLQDAAPLLAVEPAPGADPVLVPFIRAWIDSVDLVAHRLVMHLPTGLFEEDSKE
jgi:16S rRNA processing protein RimM